MILGFTPPGSQPLGGGIGFPTGLAVYTWVAFLVSGLGWATDGGRIDLPPGTAVNTGAPGWRWLVGIGPPPDAVALDQYTYDWMTNNEGAIGLGYPYWEVRYGPDRGIVPVTV